MRYQLDNLESNVRNECKQGKRIYILSYLFTIIIPDEGYSSNVPDEGYSSNVPDEGYSSSLPDEGYSRNTLCALN